MATGFGNQTASATEPAMQEIIGCANGCATSTMTCPAGLRCEFCNDQVYCPLSDPDNNCHEESGDYIVAPRITREELEQLDHGPKHPAPWPND